MTDPAIQNARTRRENLAAEINETQQRLDELRRSLADVDRFISEWAKYAGVESVDENEARPRNPDKEVIWAAAAEIIREYHRPVMRAELYLALKERGLEIFGKDPEMVLSTMMWRNQKQFVRLPSGGYWFRDEPYSPANYKPGDIPIKSVNLVPKVTRR